MLVLKQPSRVEAASTGKGYAATQGFTLLETVIALLVMMVVGLGASSLFVYSVRYNAGAAERAMALAVAQQKLEELRAVSWNDPLLAATPAAGTAICTAAAPCYSANEPFLATKFVVDSNNVTVNSTTYPTTKTITIQVTPLNGSLASGVSITSQRATLTHGPY